MPTSVLKGTAMDSLPCIKEVLLNHKPGKSGGFGGMKNKYLRCTGQNWDAREIGAFEKLCFTGLDSSSCT